MNPPSSQRILRYFSLVAGIFLLIWLPFEDTGLHWILFFALFLSVLAAVRIASHLLRVRAAHRLTGSATFYVLAGGVAGLLITPAALLLMAFKTGIHGHHAPDFTSVQIQNILILTPGWVLAGLLVGLGISLAMITRR